MRLREKVSIITGAGTGIGRAASIAFVREGSKVVAVGRRLEFLKETVRMAEEIGGEAVAVRSDVSKTEDVKKMIRECLSAFGKLDVLYNNAGIDTAGTVMDMSEDLWDMTININLKGTFLCSKYAIPEIRNQGGGSIINTSSVLGLTALPNNVAYAASKGGVINLTRAMSCDCAPLNIRVNCICPGAIYTPILEDYFKSTGDPDRARRFFEKLAPLGRIGTPGDVASLAVFLASDESSFTTGSTFITDGGVHAQWPEAHWSTFW